MPGPYRAYLGKATLISKVWVVSPSRQTWTDCPPATARCARPQRRETRERIRLIAAGATPFEVSNSASQAPSFSHDVQHRSEMMVS